MRADGATAAGRARLGAAFATCAPLTSADDAAALAFYVRGAFDELSMGNYPYPTDYIAPGLGAFPVRAACAPLRAPLSGDALYAGAAAAIAVLYNATRDARCNDVPPNPDTHPAAPYDGIWDWQQCTEMQPDSQWFAAREGGASAFWAQPRNVSYLLERCAAAHGVVPALDWITTRYALPSFTGASNIVFANGLFDPWSGVSLATSPAPARDLVVLNISQAAHHLDLFFSNPADPPAVTAARLEQMRLVRRWVDAAWADARGDGRGL
jgi:lysosomal Pro-X carboxypeptidase